MPEGDDFGQHAVTSGGIQRFQAKRRPARVKKAR